MCAQRKDLVRMPWDGWHLQARKRVVTRIKPCWTLIWDFDSSVLWENKFLLFKPCNAVCVCSAVCFVLFFYGCPRRLIQSRCRKSNRDNLCWARIYGIKVITSMRRKARPSKEEGTYLWSDLFMEDSVSGKMSANCKGENWLCSGDHTYWSVLSRGWEFRCSER